MNVFGNYYHCYDYHNTTIITCLKFEKNGIEKIIFIIGEHHSSCDKINHSKCSLLCINAFEHSECTGIMMFLDHAQFRRKVVLYLRFVMILDELKLFRNRQKRLIHDVP